MTTPPLVARREVLLQLKPDAMGAIIYSVPGTRTPDGLLLNLSRWAWLELGSPTEITVRILPGNRMDTEDA